MKTSLSKQVNLTLLMLVTGVFWGTWFTLTRSISEFSTVEFIHIGKVIIANVADPMRILMPLTVLLLGINTWLAYRKKSKQFNPLLFSLFLMLTTLSITVLVEVPIDDQIKTLTPSTIPHGWENIREKWAWHHGLRTLTSIISFIFFGIGSLPETKETI